MAQELDLDRLSKAMVDQQEGKSNGKKIVWDKTKMAFVELGSYETPDDSVSVVNDVSKRPFYNS
jgi:hypothetical protein